MTHTVVSTRAQLLQAINTLLSEPAQKDVTLATLTELYEKFLEPENAFSIASLVFGGLVNEVRSRYAQIDHSILLLRRDQLEGKIPHRISFALKYNFSVLLHRPAQEAYELLGVLLNRYKQMLEQPGQGKSSTDALDDQFEALHQLCYFILVADQLPELLVAEGAHLLLSLPDPPSPTFNLAGDTAAFSTIFPVESVENTQVQLDYIESLMRKLQGHETLFVDIHLLSEGYLMNIR